MLATWLLVAAALPALADPVGVSNWKDAGGAHIRLTWPQAIKVESAVEGRELLLRFDRPVEGDGLSGLTEQLPDWLDAVTAGYDTVLLRARQDVIWKVVPAGAEVTVDLTADPRAEGAPAPLDARLGVLRARLLSETGKADEARAILAELARRYPDSREVIAAQAEVETRAGRRTAALSILKKGLSQYPDDPTLTRAYRDTLGAEGAAAFVGVEVAGVRNAENYVSALIGVEAVPIGDAFTFGVNGEVRHLRVNDVPSSGGFVRNFDQARERAALWVEAPFADDARVRLTAYGATNTLGAGAEIRAPAADGEANAEVIYHRPYWETAEAVVNNATVDTVTAGYGTNWGEWLNVSLQLRGNRYAQDGIAFAGASGGGSFDVNAQPFDGVRPLRVVYALDAEYFGHKSTRVDSNGMEFVPLDLRSYEYHRAGLEWTEEELFVPEFFATVSGGYGIDRLGGDGAYYGLDGGYRLTPDISMLMRANRNHVTTTGPRTVTSQASATLRMRF